MPTCRGQGFGRDAREFRTETSDGRPHVKHMSQMDDVINTILQIANMYIYIILCIYIYIMYIYICMQTVYIYTCIQTVYIYMYIYMYIYTIVYT